MITGPWVHVWGLGMRLVLLQSEHSVSALLGTSCLYTRIPWFTNNYKAKLFSQQAKCFSPYVCNMAVFPLEDTVWDIVLAMW